MKDQLLLKPQLLTRTPRNSFPIQRKHLWMVFFLYGCVLFYVVFLTVNRYRGGASAHANLVPVVDNIKRFYDQGTQQFWAYYIGYWGNIFGNIFLFIPFGFLFRFLYPGKKVSYICLCGCLFSMSIEVAQLALRIGVCDIDDVILNTWGAAAGAFCWQMMKKRKPGWFGSAEDVPNSNG